MSSSGYKKVNIIELNIEKDGDTFTVSFSDGSSKGEYRLSPGFYRNLESGNLEVAGDELGYILFDGERGKVLKEKLKEIKDGKKLIIKVNSDSQEVHSLPFELVRFEITEGKRDFLLKHPDIALVRDVPSVSREKVFTSRVLSANGEKKKILVIISLPFEEFETAPLDLLEEIKLVYSALEEPLRKGIVEVEFEEKANIRNIRRKLRNRTYDIVHFTGHGRAGGYLLFEDEENPQKGKEISLEEDNSSIYSTPDGFHYLIK